MGYSAYPTDHGMAGYAIPDTCHADNCDETIDRGLAHLCGADPRWPDPGCGWWFCPTHLFAYGQDCCAWLCGDCYPDDADEAS